MSIRSIILAASTPLLILLAAVNGALLYHQSEAEMRRGLDERALAAAIVAAEFLSSADDPAALTRNPTRRAALASAAGHVEGLEGFYLVQGDGVILTLAPSKMGWKPAVAESPKAAEVGPLASADGHRYVVARAPVTGGGHVVARVDADPLYEQLGDLLRWIVAGVIAAGVVGVAAGWHVAHRIRRELAASRGVIAALDADVPLPDTSALTIAEAADLAAALRLLDVNRRTELTALHRRLAQEDGARTEGAALATWRATLFAPVDEVVAGRRVAARMLGDARPGCFFALCRGDGRATLVVGECGGADAREALALAVSARRFLEGHWHELGDAGALDTLHEAFGAECVRHVTWAEVDLAAGMHLLAVSDPDNMAAAETYVRADAEGAPAKCLDAIAALLEPDGVFAIVGPA